MTSPAGGLRHQSRGRELTADEAALAAALQAIFAGGTHEFSAVAEGLQARGVKRPSGSMAEWSQIALVEELAAINAVLDASYARDGIGA